MRERDGRRGVGGGDREHERRDGPKKWSGAMGAREEWAPLRAV